MSVDYRQQLQDAQHVVEGLKVHFETVLNMSRGINAIESF